MPTPARATAGPIEFRVHNILSAPVAGKFDGAFALDVFEHIPERLEDRFVQNICTSLNEFGIAVIGTPSLELQQYASPASKEGHVNCKSAVDLRTTLLRHFRQVFVFSMNDEVVQYRLPETGALPDGAVLHPEDELSVEFASFTTFEWRFLQTRPPAVFTSA